MARGFAARQPIPLSSPDDFRITWHKLNQASYSVKDAEIILPPGDWILTNQVTIPNGIRAVRGSGIGKTRLFMDGGASKVVTSIVLRDLYGFELSDMSLIQLNRADTQVAMVYGLNAKCVTLKRLRFETQDKGSAIYFTATAGQGNCGNILIEDCDIFAPREQPEHLGGLDSTGQEVIRFTSAMASPGVPSQLWKASKSWRQYTDRLTNVTVRRVRVDGGYYAVGCSGIDSMRIEDCSFTNPTRGVSLQDGCRGAYVARNIIRDQHSSGIHMAYGTSGCLIERNIVMSARAEGEGFIQCYTGATDNVVQDNRLIQVPNQNGASGAELRPKWFLYVGTHAHRNTFWRNAIEGKAARAAVAIENEWPNNTTQKPSRSFNGAGWDFTGFAAEALKGVFLLDNDIPPQDPGVPRLFLSSGATITAGPEVFGNDDEAFPAVTRL